MIRKRILDLSRLFTILQILEVLVVVIVMGVTGSGKTTVGALLAQRLAWQFADADSFHPQANIEKMSRGIPLNDEDRAPWLHALHQAILLWSAKRQNTVLACSSLKRAYRAELSANADVKFVYLKGNFTDIRERLEHRHGHFATDKILAGQFADLEEPSESEAFIVDARKTVDELVSEICAWPALAAGGMHDQTK